MNRATDELLRPVSRSFYLSIRALPLSLREPVGLAYLLARTSDSIADTTAVPVESRLEMLDMFASAVADPSGPPATEFRDVLVSRRYPSMVLGMTEAEARLVSSVDTLLHQLAALGSEDRTDVANLLSIITRGQRLDVERSSKQFVLETGDQLREYTYLVAGCVGEFWTRLCFRKLAVFTGYSEPEMLQLGRRYGCGLQLVNILRDVGEDLDAGRCYLPGDELGGITSPAGVRMSAHFLPVYRKWIDEAKDDLRKGIQYILAIDDKRVRIATAPPALIGIRTLTMLERRGAAAAHERIKVSRGEVRSIIGALIVTLGNRRLIERSFAQAAGD